MKGSQVDVRHQAEKYTDADVVRPTEEIARTSNDGTFIRYRGADARTHRLAQTRIREVLLLERWVMLSWRHCVSTLHSFFWTHGLWLMIYSRPQSWPELPATSSIHKVGGLFFTRYTWRWFASLTSRRILKDKYSQKPQLSSSHHIVSHMHLDSLMSTSLMIMFMSCRTLRANSSCSWPSSQSVYSLFLSEVDQSWYLNYASVIYIYILLHVW